MYQTITRYIKTTNNQEQVLFRSEEITNKDKFLKAVFMVNETNTDGVVATCLIRNPNEDDYYMFPKTQKMKAGDSVSAIQKTLILNDDDVIIFKSSVAGVECSLIIDYDPQS